MKGKLKGHLSQFLPIYFDLCSICIKKLMNGALSSIRVGDDMTRYISHSHIHTHTICSPDWLSVQDLYTFTLSLQHRKHQAVA